MNTPSNQGPEPASGKRLVVIGIVVFIACAGVTGLVARHLSKRQPAPTTQATGLPAFDVERARRELDDLQQRAMQVMGSKQNVDLVAPAKEYVQRYPHFAPGHLLLGQIYLYTGDAAASYASLEKSLQYDSQQPEVQLLAGTVAQNMQRYEQASTHFANAVALDPSNTKLRIFLANSYIQQNRHDEARMTLLQTLQINSQQHEAYFTLSQLDARQGRLEQAITQVTRAIDLLPEDEKAASRENYVRWLAKLLQRDNRPAESLQALEKLSPEQRRSASVLEDMAIAWQLLGKPANGAMLYEDALRYQPDAWPLALGAARWYLKANDKPSARRMTDALRRINPSAPALVELQQQLQ